MKKQDFETDLKTCFDQFHKKVSSKDGDWTVKGFIDIYKNIYTISIDTKVISKIFELMLFPIINNFSIEKHYKMHLCEHQNFYPDMTFIDSDGKKYALDLKSTYRKGDDKVNGMTLGAFTGYFRDRKITKNITFPYNDYEKHFVLGIIYSRIEEDKIDEKKTYTIDQLQSISSVVKDFDFFIQEKYKIAIDRPGSGNTKNIGSATNIKKLKNGTGPFSKLGLKIFDDYWVNYMTKDMARGVDLPKPPYRNLEEYFKFKNLKMEDFK